MDSSWNDLLPTIKLLVVFLGWFFLRHNGKVFAKRTEANTIAKDVQTLIDSIRKECRTHWLSSEFNDDFPFIFYISQELKKLDEKVNSLNTYNVQLDNSLIVEYRKAITMEERKGLYQCIEERKAHFYLINTLSTQIHIHIDSYLSSMNAKEGSFFVNPTGGFLTGVAIMIAYLLLV